MKKEKISTRQWGIDAPGKHTVIKNILMALKITLLYIRALLNQNVAQNLVPFRFIDLSTAFLSQETDTRDNCSMRCFTT